ncbi:hypothetical protein ACFFRR_000037 [Megaselia abdita]
MVLRVGEYQQLQSVTITNTKSDEKVQDEGHDVISRYTGHFGWWNFIWAFILSMYQMSVGFQIFAFSFQTQKKDFWCARPDDLKDTINVTTWKLMTNQSDYSCSMFYEGNHVKCDTFEFSDEIGHTIVQDFNLVCDRKNFLATIETCILVGSSIAPLFSGWLSDKFGRKLILMLSATIQLIVGTAIAFTTSLPLLMVLRFIIGYASLSVGILNAILVMELSSPKYRTIVGLINMMVAPVGNIVLALITYFLTDWRYIQLAISVPFVLILLLWYWIPQSPRWLLVMNKYDELIILMERMAKMNKKTLPNDLRMILEQTPKESEGETDSNNKINPVKIAFSKKYYITTISLIILFWTNVGMYLALSSHIVELGGNGSFNMGIAGAIELVITALAVIIALKLNLKLILLTAMISSAICCLLIMAVPQGHPFGVRVLGITGWYFVVFG